SERRDVACRATALTQVFGGSIIGLVTPLVGALSCLAVLGISVRIVGNGPASLFGRFGLLVRAGSKRDKDRNDEDAHGWVLLLHRKALHPYHRDKWGDDWTAP